MQTHTPDVPAALQLTDELERLGDEIAEFSAHLDAATARVLDLTREFDAREGPPDYIWVSVGPWRLPDERSRRDR